MPYITDGDPVGPNASAVTLEDFPSSLGASVSAAAGQAWEGSPISLADDAMQLRKQNAAGARVDRASAEQQIKDAGVKLTIPDDGYTQGALDLLIQRRHDDARRADILDRAPAGFVPSTARFAAQLATGLADPLNIAASFIPVVGEARIASMLARAGDSFVARTSARAAIGAAEGAAGAAVLEPLVYGAHAQLQDDYGMGDSLTNLLMGAAFGTVLHAAGGAVGDLMRGGALHPAARFGDLSVQDIEGVLTFERQRETMPPADQARVLESFSPAQRRAMGEGDAAAPLHVEPADGTSQVFRPGVPTSGFSDAVEALYRSARTDAEGVASRVAPELHETAMRGAIAAMAQGRFVDVEHLVHLDPMAAPHLDGGAIDTAISALQAAKERLLPIAGNLAERGVVREARQQLKEHLAQAPNASDEALVARAQEIQSRGRRMLLKTAEKQAREELAAAQADHAATAQRLQGVIESNRQAQQAVQQIGGIDRRIDSLTTARPLVDIPRPTLETARARAVLAERPEFVSVADFFAARAEEERMAEASAQASEPAKAVDEQLAAATDELKAVAKNLEQATDGDAERTKAVQEELKPFDEAIAEAKKLGQAVRAAALCGLRS